MTNLLDTYESGDFGLVIKDRRVAGRSGLDLLAADFERGAFPDPAVPQLVIQTVISATPVQVGCDLGAGAFKEVFAPGQFVVAPPDVDCDYDCSDSFSLMVTTLPKSTLGDLTTAICGQPMTDLGPLHAGLVDDPQIAALQNRIWRECRSGNPHGALFADSSVFALVALLLCNAHRIGRERFAAAVSANPRIRRAVDLMHDRIAEDLELSELAEAAAMSLSSFHRAFRSEMGCSPWQYFQRIRIARAKQLLANSRLSVTEIAFRTGYNSGQRFATVFREHTGTSPTAWRTAL